MAYTKVGGQLLRLQIELSIFNGVYVKAVIIFYSDIMEVSMELQTLMEHIDDLELALKDNFTPIINKLRKEGLIKPSIYESVQDVRSSLTPREKAGELIRGVEDAVTLSPDNYYKFIKILNGKANLYKDILLKLQSTLCGKFRISYNLLCS